MSVNRKRHARKRKKDRQRNKERRSVWKYEHDRVAFEAYMDVADPGWRVRYALRSIGDGVKGFVGMVNTPDNRKAMVDRLTHMLQLAFTVGVDDAR